MNVKIEYREEIRSFIITVTCTECGKTERFMRNIYDLGKEPHKPVRGDIDWYPEMIEQ